MKNLYDEQKAEKCADDLALRVYTSNILGQSDKLVLHGGGNTSLKSVVNGEDMLFVKGSGWDLVSIEREGFPAVKLDVLKEMAKLPSLSDSDMVSKQKEAMIDKTAPSPSVEAILHAIIPFKFVDHTHADAIVCISNCNNGISNIEKLFPNFLIVPYVMPGFILAKEIYEMSKDLDWDKCEGMILHNHGIFTFDDNAKISYDKMINAVNKAEQFLEENAKLQIPQSCNNKKFDINKLQQIMSSKKGYEVAMHFNTSDIAVYFSNQSNVCRGVLTPEHIIRTKRVPLVLPFDSTGKEIEQAINKYKRGYEAYFDKHKTTEICLNPYPNYAIIKNYGIICFAKNEKEASIINDIVSHTILAILQADKLGEYKSISVKDSFEMEYWELEQIKLKSKK